MCWSTTATAVFAGLFFVTILFTIWRRRYNWMTTTILLVYFMGMEIYQFTQWKWGNVGGLSHAIGYVGTCNSTNRIITYFSFILVHAQPALFSGIGMVAYGKYPWMRMTIFHLIVVALNSGLLIYYSLTPSVPTSWNYTMGVLDSNLGNQLQLFIL